jgi:general secretion pathway protein J
VLSALCYETLNYVRRAREGTVAGFQRLRDVELAMHLLADDFGQLAPRPVRDTLGATYVPALYADGRGTDLVALTRGGWPNPTGAPRGTLQRVTYAIEGGNLVRRYYTVLDATLASPQVKRTLLKDVVSVSFRYLDAGRAWQAQWPALAGVGPANTLPLSTRPIAVEVIIELRDVGRIRRLIEVPG